MTLPALKLRAALPQLQLILIVSCLLTAVVTADMMKGCATHGRYRLQATAYSLTPETSLELKHENCRSNFGDDASLFDFSTASKDFKDEEEFNQALAGIFFKQPNAAFFVMYEGLDKPAKVEEEDDDDETSVYEKYALKTTQHPAPGKALASFGRAHMEVFRLASQILCAVPVKEYKSSESSSSSKTYYSLGDLDTGGSSTTGTTSTFGSTVMKLVFVLGVVGTVVLIVVRKYKPSFWSEAYYSIVPQNRHLQYRRQRQPQINLDDDNAVAQLCELSSSSNTSSLILGPNEGI